MSRGRGLMSRSWTGCHVAPQEGGVAYSYRISAILGPGSGLAGLQAGATADDLPFAASDAGWTIRAASGAKPSGGAMQFVVCSSGFESEDAAREHGERLMVALRLALAQKSMAVDLGFDDEPGWMNPDVMKNAGRAAGAAVVLQGRLGLQVHETQPKTLFLNWGTLSVQAVTPVNDLISLVDSIFATSPTLTGRESLALEVFHAALFETGRRARFLLLVSAAESLFDPIVRGDDARTLVDQFIRQTRGSGLESHEVESMVGALRWLRRESISQTGRRLASRLLAGREYGGITSDRFFSKLYGVRSSLVHAGTTGLSHGEFLALVGQAQAFVRDLILAHVHAVKESPDEPADGCAGQR